MIELIRENDKAVIRPAGEEVVAASAPEFRSKLFGVLEEGVRELVVDFVNVRMVDSAGIGLLLHANSLLRKLGGRLAVVHVSKDVLDLFRLMRIHQHFSVSGD